MCEQAPPVALAARRASSLLGPAGARLAQAGAASPEADARTLLAWALGVEPYRLAFTDVDEAAAARFEAAVDGRAVGVPLQYLTGVAHFRTVDVRVGPGVFIPRPETEALAGWALERLSEATAPPRVVELCAGSGAITKALIAEGPGGRYWAVESDPVAFGYLRANLATDADLVPADMAGALADLDGTIDLVIANPPYIPEVDRDLVASDVLAHEPHTALFSGQDGLDGLRVAAQAAARLLAPGGWVGIEHDEETGTSAVAELAALGCFSRIEDFPDLTGRPRFVTACKEDR